MFKRIVIWKLAMWARMALWRNRATVIAVTGSVGKTTTKEAIGKVLRSHFGEKRVVVSEGNYNTEVGVPLSILRSRHPGRSLLGWFMLGLRAARMVLQRGAADIYVLEFAADKPGDIKHLVRMTHPRIGVVTAVGEIPVHVEYYESPEEVVAEKGRLIEGLPRDGIAILNVDEGRVWEMRERTFAEVVGVGVGGAAAVRAQSVSFYPENLFSETEPAAILKVETVRQSVPLRLNCVLTRGQVLAAIIAVAVGRAMNVPLLECVEALHDWEPPMGRMRPVRGVRGSILLDDTYNASPLSMQLALETLALFKNNRRVAVLGDMRELGRYGEEAHDQVGRHVAKHADVVVAVGRYAAFLARGAETEGMAEENIIEIRTAREAADFLYGSLRRGDVLLVKGSRAVGMELVIRTLQSDAR